MDLRRIARETCDTLVNYLTYQAFRVILSQLQETNPSLYLWLQHFSARYSFQYSGEYLEALYKAKPELALRIMTVRESLVEDIADSLPEMSRTSIHQANMSLRRKMLEHLTQISDADISSADISNADISDL
ncbi:MAG: hypothetical protein HC857_01365 [Synechococcales cyanobacterium RU_4_20]|nr:hypothetical protein [Synechococcales cyanobacterium RU_4_20]NJR69872.1 hypothetical protein [Synechococcales cyanobacterium CRU_2_2]